MPTPLPDISTVVKSGLGTPASKTVPSLLTSTAVIVYMPTADPAASDVDVEQLLRVTAPDRLDSGARRDRVFSGARGERRT